MVDDYTTTQIPITIVQTILNNFQKANTSRIEECKLKYDSALFYDQTRKLNIFISIIIILIGIFGNTLAVIVFIQKRFRLKSPGVFLLCLAVSDGLFLLIHFFEDTLRTYIDVYIDKQDKVNLFDPKCPELFHGSTMLSTDDHLITQQNFLKILNITDNFNITCRLVNYFRYFLRFISAYIITIFTIQRAVVIFCPLYQSKYSSTWLAWRIIIILNIFAALICLFIPFLFQLSTNEGQTKNYCDINKDSATISKIYFVTTIIYIVLIMFIPITTIILCNTLIIFQLCRAGKNRRVLCNIPIEPSVTATHVTAVKTRVNSLNHSKNHIYVPDQQHKKLSFSSVTSTTTRGVYTPLQTNGSSMSSNHKNIIKLKNESFKVTRMLIIMSLSYAILNLPYFCAWCMFYYKIAINHSITYTSRNYLFGALNIAEVFYVLNYGIHFFLYCASGQRFRAQLRYSLMNTKCCSKK